MAYGIARFQASTRRFWRCRRGTIAVEMALGIPVLLTLLVGFVTIGHAVQYHEALTDGTRSALRYLARVGNPCSPEPFDLAAGLAVTRSLGWTGSPQFAAWPTAVEWGTTSAADITGANPVGPDDFKVVLLGCETGTPAEYLTLTMRYRYVDPVGLLGMIDLPDQGFWIGATHQQRYIGG